MSEQGITNLGPVPAGMAFLDAIRASEGQRKHHINPHHESRRLTYCEVMREVWRIAEGLTGAEGAALQDLAAAGFDFGKRMDARMKELKCLASR